MKRIAIQTDLTQTTTLSFLVDDFDFSGDSGLSSYWKLAIVLILTGVDGKGGTGGMEWSKVSIDFDGRTLATACRRSASVGRLEEALTLPTDMGSMRPTTRRLGVFERLALVGVVRLSSSSSEEAAEDDTSPRWIL